MSIYSISSTVSYKNVRVFCLPIPLMYNFYLIYYIFFFKTKINCFNISILILLPREGDRSKYNHFT